MKDLLLLPFYLTAFFSNSLQHLDSSEVHDKINEQYKLEINIDLPEFFKMESSVSKRVNSKNFDQEAFKIELLKSNRKK